MLALRPKEPKPEARPNVCRLTMDIGGTLYRIVPVRAEGGGILGFKFVRQDEDRTYTVTGLGCSCPSDRYRKRGRNGEPAQRCKHYRAALACGLAL